MYVLGHILNMHSCRASSGKPTYRNEGDNNKEPMRVRVCSVRRSAAFLVTDTRSLLVTDSLQSPQPWPRGYRWPAGRDAIWPAGHAAEGI